jgi:hypothetical protein
MPAHPNPISMIVVTEMRREELLKQARQERLLERLIGDGRPGRCRQRPAAKTTLSVVVRALAPRFPPRLRDAIGLSLPAPGETG